MQKQKSNIVYLSDYRPKKDISPEDLQEKILIKEDLILIRKRMSKQLADELKDVSYRHLKDTKNIQRLMGEIVAISNAIAISIDSGEEELVILRNALAKKYGGDDDRY